MMVIMISIQLSLALYFPANFYIRFISRRKRAVCLSVNEVEYSSEPDPSLTFNLYFNEKVS